MRIRNGEKGRLRQAHADVQDGKLVIYTAGAKQEIVFVSEKEVVDLANKLLSKLDPVWPSDRWPEAQRWFMALPEDERKAVNVEVNKEFARTRNQDLRSTIQQRHILEAMKRAEDELEARGLAFEKDIQTP